MTTDQEIRPYDGFTCQECGVVTIEGANGALGRNVYPGAPANVESGPSENEVPFVICNGCDDDDQPDPDDDEEGLTEAEFACVLRDVLSEVGLEEFGGGARLDVSTFAEAGLLTRNDGLVIRVDGDAEYQVTVVRSR
jgi:hypothetical protein